MDFAGLSALSGIDNWAQKRQDRANDMQYVAIMNAMAKQENQKQQQSAQEVQNYLNTVGKIKVLDQDKKRIADKEKEYAVSIQDGIKKSHGNINRWLETGGRTELMKYYNNIVDSQEVQKGLSNAISHQRYLADQQLGLTPRNVDVNGKEMPYEEQYKMFEEGKLDELKYYGGYEEPTGDPAKAFGERFGNAEGKPQIASPQEVYDYWLNVPKGKGMSEQDRMLFARKKANDYIQQYGAQGERGGYPFKSLTPEQLDYSRREKIKEIQNNERLKLLQEKANNGLGADPFTQIHSGAVSIPTKQKVNAYAYMDIFGGKPQEGTPEGQDVEVLFGDTKLSEKSKTPEANYIGLRYDKNADEKNGGYVGKVENAENIISPTTFQKAKASINDMDGVVIKDLESVRTVMSPEGQPKPYVIARVKFKNRSQMNDFGAVTHAPFRSETGAWQGDVDWDNNEVKVMIPITDPTHNPLGHRQWNTELKRYGQVQIDNDPFLEDSKIE